MVAVLKGEPVFILKLTLQELFFLKDAMQNAHPEENKLERRLRENFFEATSGAIKEHGYG